MLTKKSHRGLHICENKDFILYSEINDFFREIILLNSPLDDYLINESKEYKKAQIALQILVFKLIQLTIKSFLTALLSVLRMV